MQNAQRKTYCDSDIPKGCCSVRHDFDIHPFPGGDWTGDHDFNFIMQYAGDLGGLHGKLTLVSKVREKKVPEDPALASSQMDFDRICKVYVKES